MEGAAIAVVPGDDGDGHELTRVPRVPDAPREPRRDRHRRSASIPSGCDSSRRTSVDRSGRSTGPLRIIVAVRVAHELGPTGEVDRDPLGEHDRDAARPRSGAVPGARLAATTAPSSVCAAASSATPARTAASAACSPSVRPGSMSQGVYRIPKIGYDCAVAITNLAPMGRVPRRRASRGDGDARAHPRHGGGRARHRPGRAPPPQLPAARRVPVLDRHRRHLRRRRLRRRAHRGAAHRRLRRRCAPSRRPAGSATT